MSDLARAITRRRLAAICLSLCVLCLELMLIFWGLFMGANLTGPGSSSANGKSAALAVVNLQASAEARAARRPAKAKASQTPKPKLFESGPPAAPQAEISPDRAALLDDLSAAAFEPLSGLHGADDPCSLAQDLATDLQTDPFAQRAVQTIPVQSLSVAGALLLWDGHWVVSDPTDAGSAMLRTIVLREIAAAKPECLTELNPGPQFLYINGGTSTVTIVIGSGQWRWGDLATSQ
ncbi:MAG: hypothetical protein ACKVOL_07315 [Novosphingobium sp.]